jgi:hypothetical protein
MFLISQAVRDGATTRRKNSKSLPPDKKSWGENQDFCLFLNFAAFVAASRDQLLLKVY